jgi:uncharacterized membrane protein
VDAVLPFALPFALTRALLGLLILGAGVWMGGFVAIMVVNATSKKSLEAAQRIALFRGLGRSYLRVAAIAFLLVVVPGGVLLAFRPWDGFTLAILLVALLLVVLTGIAVRQARRMTRMRKAALAAQHDAAPRDIAQRDAASADESHAAPISRNARRAWMLRMGIGLTSLTLLVLALATP